MRTVAGKSYEELSAGVQKTLADQKVQFKYVLEALLQRVNDAASQLALQAPISNEEFERLFAILGAKGFNITEYRAEYASRRWFGVTECLMSATLGFVLNHKAVPYAEPVAFNLRSGEAPVFEPGNCVPIGGGIYYQFGGSQGRQERTSGLVPVDGGKVLITSHALYLGGQQTTLRIPLERVLRYQPYIDGVGVCESHGAPKAFVFDYRSMDTGWFFYNVLMALTNNLLSRSSG
jgi:hypothetical protein